MLGVTLVATTTHTVTGGGVERMFHHARRTSEDLRRTLRRAQKGDEARAQQLGRWRLAVGAVPSERRLDGGGPLRDRVRTVVRAGTKEVMPVTVIEIERVHRRLGLEPAVDQRCHERADARHRRAVN